MFDRLIGLILKDSELNHSSARARAGKLSGIVGIAANAVLFLGKLLVGTVSGSVSITADAMNNLSDASSAIVTYLGFRLLSELTLFENATPIEHETDFSLGITTCFSTKSLI